jgi:hypothetical protein
MSEKAVIDRFEGELAVLLVGEEQRLVNVPMTSLPEDATEGAWLQVELDGNSLVGAEIDVAQTERARQRVMEKLERLRRGEQLDE